LLRAGGGQKLESVAMTTPCESAPVLWLRPNAGREVLVEHLRHVAGIFAAAGWSVVSGQLQAVAPGLALAVLDDPWVEPLPKLATALAEVHVAGPPVWRVPHVFGLTGPQGWRPKAAPGTLLEYDRQSVDRTWGAPVPLGSDAWCGFAVASPADAPGLLHRGWPPSEVALVANTHLYRYPDPSSHERRELLPFVPEVAQTIVDVGCGTGLFGALLRRPGRKVVGIEPEWELARVARTKLDLVLPVSGEEGLRAIRTPVDCIVFADVLEHTMSPSRLLRAATETIRQGGRIVVSFPNAAWGPVVRALAAGRWDPTPTSFAVLARECGLEITAQAPLGGGLPWRERAWVWMAALTAGADPKGMMAPQWVAVLRRR
jgi:SAM-dependent methyltransferase